ncbi:MAG: PQQ-binding-like beta-propeller repeat protein [Thermoleophilia bacterium]|nr:PQQ-binding-like beta-propeller repeat protein [Thermoleophilia bacterium]
MRRRSPGIALALAGLGAAALAGCSGGGDGAASTNATSTAPAGPQLEALDGDTRKPVAGAMVTVFTKKGKQTPVEIADVRSLPAAATRVRVDAAGYTVGQAAVAKDGGPVRVLMYRPALQSPEYGGGPARTRYVPAVKVPRPGNRKPRWTFDARTLIEFPPAVKNGLAVFGVNSGRVFALDARTGKVRWARRQKSYIASTPAIAGPRVYVTSMDGMLTAYRVNDGKKTFQFSTGGSPVESSPLVVGDLAYFGTWKGTLYAINLRTGKPKWTFQAAADIKASAVLAGGNIVVGDYAGNVYALNPRTGAQVWRASVGQRFYGGAGFANGTVVIGDVGGAVIALDAADGREKWRHSTGGAYVYSSPAIADGTVYIGDFNGRFMALSLANGAQRWSFDAGGRISGSATVVGDTVYTSVLTRPGEPKRTYGLSRRTGREVFRTDDGRYSPAVAAGTTLFLVGTRRLYAYPAAP